MVTSKVSIKLPMRQGFNFCLANKCDFIKYHAQKLTY